MSAESATLSPGMTRTDVVPNDVTEATIAADPILPSLKLRALLGSAWTIGDYVVGRGLSLMCNVVLSWWIAPNAFGLMATISVFLMGLAMFSDIGIGPNIIFSKRGNRQDFLNTAWTIQVIRGTALFVVACIIAWPVAVFYGEPMLVLLLPICGFNSVILGFVSTSLVTLNRDMRLGVITVLDMIGQILQIATMVGWAYWISRDVWALVVGSFVASVFRVIYSHAIPQTQRNRFTWNREDARSMFRFGRWIFMSTVLTFFASQLDRLMFAKMLGMAMAGIYNVAWQFAIVPQHLIKKIGSVVAFPVLAEVVRERPHELPRQFRRVRFPVVLISLATIIVLMVIARPMIDLLYKGAYEKAGPILRILAVGALGGILNSTYGSVLLAMGKTFQIMALLVTYILFLVTGTALGYHLHHDPETGFIWGVAAVEWLNYPFNAAVVAYYGLWQWRLDLAVIITSGCAIALMFMMP